MYAKILNTELIKFPYMFEDLQADNPFTNYGINRDFVSIFPGTDDAILRGFKLVEVIESILPVYEPRTQKLESKIVNLAQDNWVRNYDVVSKTAEEMSEEQNLKEIEVREQRNQLLKDTDWTQVLDAPVDRESWAIYRQILRNITIQEGFPWSVEWPQKGE